MEADVSSLGKKVADGAGDAHGVFWLGHGQAFLLWHGHLCTHSRQRGEEHFPPSLRSLPAPLEATSWKFWRCKRPDVYTVATTISCDRDQRERLQHCRAKPSRARQRQGLWRSNVIPIRVAGHLRGSMGCCMRGRHAKIDSSRTSTTSSTWSASMQSSHDDVPFKLLKVAAISKQFFVSMSSNSRTPHRRSSAPILESSLSSGN